MTAPNLREFVMARLLSKKEVCKLVLYSPAHIDRLEAQGLFPKRVRLGQNRVGWWEPEVMEWLEARAGRPLTVPS